MKDIAAYIDALVQQRNNLATNINEKGVEASIAEKFNTLTGKVLQIVGGSRLINKTITENGEYNPLSDDADGYSRVVVNVASELYSGAYSITPLSVSQTLSTSGKVMQNDLTIEAFPQASIIRKSISENGVYDPTSDNADGFGVVTVSVPNSYSLADNGKVVSGSALVAQTSRYITTNGTYDTTTKNQVVVNVPGGGGGSGKEHEIIARTISSYEDSEITEIGSYAFAYCSYLESVSFPAVTSIGWNAFNNCVLLSEVSFPAATFIGASAFAKCESLESVSFPEVTDIRYSAFTSCTNLVEANFPIATYANEYAFASCSKLASISLPLASEIGSAAFLNCYSLTSADFPSVKTIYSYAFQRCYYLSVVSLPVVSKINYSAFNSCTRLVSLYLGGSSVCTLGAGVFNSTPIGGYSAMAQQYGKIYVKSSLYNAYLSASGWSSYSGRIYSF